MYHGEYRFQLVINKPLLFFSPPPLFSICTSQLIHVFYLPNQSIKGGEGLRIGAFDGAYQLRIHH